MQLPSYSLTRGVLRISPLITPPSSSPSPLCGPWSPTFVALLPLIQYLSSFLLFLAVMEVTLRVLKLSALKALNRSPRKLTWTLLRALPRNSPRLYLRGGVSSPSKKPFRFLLKLFCIR